MRGRPLVDLQQLGERLFVDKIEKRIYPEMRALVQAHMDRGHTVVLSSSALTIQVEPVARFLGIPATLTNRFEVDVNGLLTGKVVEPILWGPGKANAVQAFADEHGIDLKDSYFYADGDEDVALMHLVGATLDRPTRVTRCARWRGKGVGRSWNSTAGAEAASSARSEICSPRAPSFRPHPVHSAGDCSPGTADAESTSSPAHSRR